jgi:transcription antitermination factor NusG
VRLVGFGGQPAALPDQEIDSLRQGLTRDMRVEPHPYLKVGHRVRVRTGPLQGLEGILVRKKNISRFVISLDLIMRSLAVEIDRAELEPVR